VDFHDRGAMTYILIWADEHKIGDLHYHMKTDLGQKRVFMRFKKKLPELLPNGCRIRYYAGGSDDIGILDANGRQHIHIYYIQRRFPHNLHVTFSRESFKLIFIEMLRKCFPRSEVELIELEELR